METRRQEKEISSFLFFFFFHGRWKRNSIIHLPFKKKKLGEEEGGYIPAETQTQKMSRALIYLRELFFFSESCFHF
jgi:hypothetical protein